MYGYSTNGYISKQWMYGYSTNGYIGKQWMYVCSINGHIDKQWMYTHTHTHTYVKGLINGKLLQLKLFNKLIY